MSFASETRQTGYALLESVDGACLSLLNSAGGVLHGVFSTAPYIDPPFEIASDIREKACLEVIREFNQAGIASASLNDQAQDEAGNKWMIIFREDNPAVFTTKYWLVKVVPTVDT